MNRCRLSSDSERKLEWWLACFTVFYGTWLMLSPHGFSSPGYHVINEWATETTWGIIALVVGAIHCAALYVNGLFRYSPFVRTGAAALNAIFFAVISVGFAQATPAAISVAIYVGFTWAAFIVFSAALRDSVRVCAPRATRGGGGG